MNNKQDTRKGFWKLVLKVFGVLAAIITVGGAGYEIAVFVYGYEIRDLKLTLQKTETKYKQCIPCEV